MCLTISLCLQATGKKKATPGGSLDQALERMCQRTRELRGQVKETSDSESRWLLVSLSEKHTCSSIVVDWLTHV